MQRVRKFAQQLTDLGGARLHFSVAGRDDERERFPASRRDAGHVADGPEDGVYVGFFIDGARAGFSVVEFEGVSGKNTEHDGCDVAFRLGDEKKGEQVQQLEMSLA